MHKTKKMDQANKIVNYKISKLIQNHFVLNNNEEKKIEEAIVAIKNQVA